MPVDLEILRTLLNRATTAETDGAEFEVLYDAVRYHHQAFGLPPFGSSEVYMFCLVLRHTFEGYMPRACLVGVVASLIPPGMGWSLTVRGDQAGAKVGPADDGRFPMEWILHPRGHMALFIATLYAVLGERTDHA